MQFGIRSLLGLMLGLGLLLAGLRWVGLPPAAIGVVLAIVAAGGAAAVALAVALGRWLDAGRPADGRPPIAAGHEHGERGGRLPAAARPADGLPGERGDAGLKEDAGQRGAGSG